MAKRRPAGDGMVRRRDDGRWEGRIVVGHKENGDSIYTYSAGYICRNLPNTAKLLLRSFSAQGAQWVQGVLGTALGEPIVYTVDASLSLIHI